MFLLREPAAALLLVPALLFALWVWRHGYINLSPRRKTLALGVRLLLLLAIVLALAGLSVRVGQGREAVVFVADLSASDAGNRSAVQTFINQAVQRRPGDSVAGIVAVGRQALVEQPASALSGFGGFQSSVDPNATNLETGLELGNAILPDGYRRRLVLLSDGQQNVGDALTAARILHGQRVRIDVVPELASPGRDVRVDGVSVPSELRVGERFSLHVALHSNVDTAARLDVYRDRALILSRDEIVRRGENNYVFDQSPLAPGVHTYQIRATAPGDVQPQNNTGSAFTMVQGAPRVLMIAGNPAEAANVASALRSTGTAVDVRPPGQVTPALSFLERYAGVVIVDTAAPLLGQSLMEQIVPYVRDLGRGLVVVGGQESYGLGAYGGTPLEKALPVKMDLPRRKDVPSAAVVLIVESLEATLPVNISKEAAKGVVRLLTEQDRVAVNDTPNDGTSGWVVPLQPARNKQAILQAIGEMLPGDPNSYSASLLSAYQVLAHARAKVKHIILLGDGDAAAPGYQSLVRKIHAAGITLSTIVTNALSPADLRTMQDLARWGGGRFYRADDPKVIPSIFLREAQNVARSGIVQGKFYPQKLSDNPMLRDLHRMPPLYGYVATAPRPTAELDLVSKRLDPVLAGWQFGLGRAVVWTSDVAGLWSRDWMASPDSNRFWADVVAWTLPSPGSNRLFVSTWSANGQGQISVDTGSKLGADPTVTARVVTPSLQTSTVQLQPTAPGQYRGAFAARTQGSYVVSVEARGAGHASTGQAGLDVPYSAEFRTTGADLPLLRDLARAGGGTVIARPESVWADNVSPVYDQRSLTDVLWLIALLLLPVDIALRRLLLRRRDLAALWDAVRSPRSREPAPAARPAWAEGGAAWSAAQSLDAPAGEGTGGRRRAGAATAERADALPGLRTGKRPATARRPATAAEATVGQLLASKRRRS